MSCGFFHSYRLKGERLKNVFHSRNTQQNKMPFNNLPWLSDKRNVWTRELIFDFKIFQSFLLRRFANAERKKFSWNALNNSRLCYCAPSGLHHNHSTAAEALAHQRTKSGRNYRSMLRERDGWDEKCAMKDLAEIFIGNSRHFKINLSRTLSWTSKILQEIRLRNLAWKII